jgi:hypothetical protein
MERMNFVMENVCDRHEKVEKRGEFLSQFMMGLEISSLL